MRKVASITVVVSILALLAAAAYSATIEPKLPPSPCELMGGCGGGGNGG